MLHPCGRRVIILKHEQLPLLLDLQDTTFHPKTNVSENSTSAAGARNNQTPGARDAKSLTEKSGPAPTASTAYDAAG